MVRKKGETPVRSKSTKRVEAPPLAGRRAPQPATAAPSRLRRPERGERISVYVPPELAEALRVRCARERRSVSDAVTEALATWLKP